MKKLILILSVIVLIAVFTSCKKEEEYCAYCTESTYGGTGSYCSTESIVDGYIYELEHDHANGMNWECQKLK